MCKCASVHPLAPDSERLFIKLFWIRRLIRSENRSLRYVRGFETTVIRLSDSVGSVMIELVIDLLVNDYMTPQCALHQLYVIITISLFFF